MKYGIELECWFPSNGLSVDPFNTAANLMLAANLTGFEAKYDCSLYNGPSGFAGIEFVSPILDSDNASHTAQVQALCAMLQNAGCRVDRHCGFHVHLDAATLSTDDVKRVFARYTDAEGEIDAFMPGNRRGDATTYAKSGKNHTAAVNAAQTKIALARSLPDRYFRVNLASMDCHGTLEFRQHSATINANTVLRWVSFLVQFVNASRVQPVATAPVAVPVIRRRGRQPSATGIPAGMQKILNAFMAAGTSLRLSALVAATGLTPNSVRAYISTLKTQHGMNIGKSLLQNSSTDPLYVWRNMGASPRTSTARSTVATVDAPLTLWTGIDKAIVAHYQERAMELAAFAR